MSTTENFIEPNELRRRSAAAFTAMLIERCNGDVQALRRELRTAQEQLDCIERFDRVGHVGEQVTVDVARDRVDALAHAIERAEETDDPAPWNWDRGAPEARRDR